MINRLIAKRWSINGHVDLEEGISWICSFNQICCLCRVAVPNRKMMKIVSEFQFEQNLFGQCRRRTELSFEQILRDKLDFKCIFSIADNCCHRPFRCCHRFPTSANSDSFRNSRWLQSIRIELFYRWWCFSCSARRIEGSTNWKRLGQRSRSTRRLRLLRSRWSIVHRPIRGWRKWLPANWRPFANTTTSPRSSGRSSCSSHLEETTRMQRKMDWFTHQNDFTKEWIYSRIKFQIECIN